MSSFELTSYAVTDTGTRNVGTVSYSGPLEGPTTQLIETLWRNLAGTKNRDEYWRRCDAAEAFWVMHAGQPIHLFITKEPEPLPSWNPF
jgi:hypothetical protein